jgi:dTDP-4-dehydrorhamnose reductase
LLQKQFKNCLEVICHCEGVESNSKPFKKLYSLKTVPISKTSSLAPRILITGGSGLLALNWAWAMRDQWQVILGTHKHMVKLDGTTSYKLDLDDPQNLSRQIDQLEPDLIVHTAGLTSVDLCENDPLLARHINAELAQNIAQIVADRNIQLIHISTDHLFSNGHSFYTEEDATQPLNEYAVSKLLAEDWVRQMCPSSLIVRTNFFGWGHAQRQSFSDWIIYNLRAGNELSLFDDVYFTPILADVLATSAHDLISMNMSGIFNLVGDERLSKYDFAIQVATCFGLSLDLIRRDQVEQASLRAKRPKDMSLDNKKARKLLGKGLGDVGGFLDTLKKQEAQGRRQIFYQAVS